MLNKNTKLYLGNVNPGSLIQEEVVPASINCRSNGIDCL